MFRLFSSHYQADELKEFKEFKFVAWWWLEKSRNM
jgi:hypothetical protein